MRLGFEAIRDRADIVVIHDAARPFASADLVSRTIDAAVESGAALAALAASDTVKLAAEGGADDLVVERTVPRERVYLAQTPQAFRTRACWRPPSRPGPRARWRPTRPRSPRRRASASGSWRASREREDHDHDRPEGGRGRCGRRARAGPPCASEPATTCTASSKAGRSFSGGVTVPSEKGAGGPLRCRRRSRTPSPTRFSARSPGETSAGTFRTPTRGGRARRAWRCCAHAVTLAARAGFDDRERRRGGHRRAPEAGAARRGDPRQPARACWVSSRRASASRARPTRVSTPSAAARRWPSTPSCSSPDAARDRRPIMRVRFAPSPTGLLHVGNARTALFNWLLARGRGRHVHPADRGHRRRAVDARVRAGHPRGPAVARARLGRRARCRRLARAVPAVGAAGPLPVVRQRAHRAAATRTTASVRPSSSRPTGAPPSRRAGRRSTRARAATSTRAAVAERLDAGRAGRRPLPRARRTGRWPSRTSCAATVQFETAVIGDPVLVRSDGNPAYNFAVVVDDALMEITHVIRGEDHISNTPRQVLLYEALRFDAAGLRAPRPRAGPRSHAAVEAARRDVGRRVPEPRLPARVARELPRAARLVARRRRRGAARTGAGPAFRARGRRPQRRRCSTSRSSRGSTGTTCAAAEPARLAELAMPHFIAAGFVRNDTPEARAYLASVVPLASGSVDRIEQIAPRGWRSCSTSIPAGACERAEVREVLSEAGAREVIAALAAELAGGAAPRSRGVPRGRRAREGGDRPEGQAPVPPDPRRADRRGRRAGTRPGGAGHRPRGGAAGGGGLAPILGCRERAARFAAWLDSGGE